MTVKSLECQLAQAQLGRYVAGDNISEEALVQLEAHISACPDCQEAAAAKRKALAPSPTAAVRMADRKPTNDNRSPKSYVKPLVLSAVLAAVLLTMGSFASNPSRLFGERASTQPQAQDSTPPQVFTKPHRDKSLTPIVAPQPNAQDLRPKTLSPNPQPLSPKPNHSTQNLRPKSSPRIPSHQPLTPKTKSVTPNAGIRVYDASGNPINRG